MNKYELLLIFDPGLSDTEVNGKAEQIKKWIEELKGKVEEVKDNGIERLAYEVKKSRQGHNVTVIFELAPGNIDELKREMKLEESVWRSFVKRK